MWFHSPREAAPLLDFEVWAAPLAVEEGALVVMLSKVRLTEVEELETTLALDEVDETLEPEALELTEEETEAVLDAETEEVLLPEADDVLEDDAVVEPGLLEMAKFGLVA